MLVYISASSMERDKNSCEPIAPMRPVLELICCSFMKKDIYFNVLKS